MIKKQNIVIVGGGASALMLACCLDSTKYTIAIYEKNSALARKFLVAGKGGFNLTHSENINEFVTRYHPSKFMKPYLTNFTNVDLQDWLKKVGIDTYVGSSKRVFPTKDIKPIEVLKAIEKKIVENNVNIHYNHEWKGFLDDALVFKNNDKQVILKSDIVVFALGGASWKVTGSNDAWANYFSKKNIRVNPFYPSNCAYKVNWNLEFINRHEGQALKNCTFSCGAITHKGEAVVTQFGIEGSGVYPLSTAIRDLMLNDSTKKEAIVYIDFKPDVSLEEIRERLANKGKLSIKEVLEKKIKLTPTQVDLLKAASTKEEYQDIYVIGRLIKQYPVTITDFAPIDDAISTVGGIALHEVSGKLELNKLLNTYCMGEMLDWDAPTGGYLLQGCFSMGNYLAHYLNSKI